LPKLHLNIRSNQVNLSFFVFELVVLNLAMYQASPSRIADLVSVSFAQSQHPCDEEELVLDLGSVLLSNIKRKNRKTILHRYFRVFIFIFFVFVLTKLPNT